MRRLSVLPTLLAALLILTAEPARADEMPVEAPAVQHTPPAEAEASPPTGPVAELVVQALSFLGIPYRYGGQSRDTGLDCSALVQQVFRDALGLVLPRTTRDLAKVGEDVERTSLKAGDLVFFNTRRRAFSHVGLYLGNNRFLHAPSKGGKVRVERLSTHYWASRFNGGRRVLTQADHQPTASAI
ncbi:MAG: C40 family peptidase [Rhodocyclaceae bacterium]|nr:C40 family peptidase [Rhodocyclaceae bacterium]